MKDMRIFIVFYSLFLGGILLNGYTASAQSLEARTRISNTYKKSDVELLRKRYQPKRLSATTDVASRDARYLVEQDSLGVAFFYKTMDEKGGQIARVLDFDGNPFLGFSGSGMIVGLWDSNLPRLDHLGLQGHIQVKDNSEVSLYSTHATHVAGIMVAAGRLNKKARGLIEESMVWAHDWAHDFDEMIDLAEQGVLVSNHSYGLDPEGIPKSYFGGYLSSSQRLDAITATFEYYQPVVAAGNDREKYGDYNPSKNGSDLLLGMTTAKNAVVVAALDGENPESVRVASFSNWGPTDDLRIKPDIAALGVKVLSTIDKSSNSYGVLSGTSMATPMVTSVFAIWQEAALAWLEKPLKSASLRALMAHTAAQVGELVLPNHQVGWGLIDNKEGLEVLKKVQEQEYAYLKEKALRNQEVHRYRFYYDGIGSLKVTLSWTDRAGVLRFEDVDSSDPDLIHDLDLRLIGENGKIYYPWRLERGSDGGVYVGVGDNRADNIEQIDGQGLESGTYTVEISHKSNLKNQVQSYSLLMSGGKQFIDLDVIEIGGRNEEFLLWPNPAFDYAVLSGPFQDMRFEIEVLTVEGKRLKRVNYYFQNNNIIFDIGDLPVGLYMIRIYDGIRDVGFKLIKVS